jgi:hypothetical protein
MADLTGESVEAVRTDPALRSIIEAAAPGFLQDCEAVLAALERFDGG